MPEYFRDGTVVRVLSHTVTPPVTSLTDKHLQNAKGLLRPSMRDPVTFNSGCGFASEEVCMDEAVLGV